MTMVIVDNEIIAKAMSFSIERVLKRYDDEEELSLAAAREHEQELKRFLALCAMNPETHYGMKGPIDKLWHTFIIFTRDYHLFCREVAGRYLHHEPTDEEAKRAGDSGESYKRFLNDYRIHFGEPPAHLWLKLLEPGDLSRGDGASCGNACGCSPGGSCDGGDSSGDAE